MAIGDSTVTALNPQHIAYSYEGLWKRWVLTWRRGSYSEHISQAIGYSAQQLMPVLA